MKMVLDVQQDGARLPPAEIRDGLLFVWYSQSDTLVEIDKRYTDALRRFPNYIGNALCRPYRPKQNGR